MDGTRERGSEREDGESSSAAPPIHALSFSLSLSPFSYHAGHNLQLPCRPPARVGFVGDGRAGQGGGERECDGRTAAGGVKAVVRRAEGERGGEG